MLRIKQRSEDFRVRELLREDVLVPRGEWRVYRVVKRKQTSMQAAARLAELAGASPGEVSMAGLKDRQGVTVQHMALHKGKEVSVRDEDLRIESIGYAQDELSSEASEGNAFELVVRGLETDQLAKLRENIPIVREQGVVNYFDDQRFGNLRYGQGWIALKLLRGEYEAALKDLLTASSGHDDRHNASFKSALEEAWGDWPQCRSVCGRFGAYHSIFEHLKREPTEFAAAFRHVSTRLRLIHLYAFQSHVWNRAVAGWVRETFPVEERVVVDSLEGPLVFPTRAVPEERLPGQRFRLPGPRLEDVENEVQRAFLTDALAGMRLVPAQFEIRGVPGFALKGEDRDLFVVPRHLRVRPADPDPLNRGLRMIKLRFELPRGSYATLVVKRLFGVGIGDVRSSARPVDDRRRREGGPGRGGARDERGRPRGGPGRDERGGPRGGPWQDKRDGPRGGSGRDERGGPRGGPWQDKRDGSRGGSGRDERGGPRGGPWQDKRDGPRGGSGRDERGGPRGGPWQDRRDGPRGGSGRDERGGPRGGPWQDRRDGPRGGSGRDERGGPRGGPWQDKRDGPRGGPGRDERGGPRGGPWQDKRDGPRGGSGRDERGGPRGGPWQDRRDGPRGGSGRDERGGPRGGPWQDKRDGPRGGSGRDERGGPRGGYGRDARGGPRGGPGRDERGGPRGGPGADDRGGRHGPPRGNPSKGHDGRRGSNGPRKPPGRGGAGGKPDRRQDR